MVLNKVVRSEIQSENYLLFKKFLQTFSLNKRLKRSDIIVNSDVVDLFKRNVLQAKGQAESIRPLVYYTDGGVYKDTAGYSLHQLFGKGDQLYSSKYLSTLQRQTGIHLQAYLGRETNHTKVSLNPSDFKKSKHDPMIIQLPIEECVVDKKEAESYKQITQLTINRLTTHYSSFCKSLVVCVSEKEIKCNSSQVLKVF